MITGKIRIKSNKVYFEPHDEKQLIVVVNDYTDNDYGSGYTHLWIENKSNLLRYLIKDGRFCKAEIKDNKATIIELIK